VETTANIVFREHDSRKKICLRWPLA